LQEKNIAADKSKIVAGIMSMDRAGNFINISGSRGYRKRHFRFLFYNIIVLKSILK